MTNQAPATVEYTGPPIGIDQGRPAFLGSQHMVSSSHYLASMAGSRMFAKGGNAIDAGVAAGIALNVTERHLTDFGGIAPIMVFTPGMAAPETLDGVGRWPASLSLEDYRAKYGSDIPPGIPRAITPGACGSWLTALARYGRLTLEEILEPNIELCETGFPVYPDLAKTLNRLQDQIRRWPTTAEVFLPGGEVPQPGDLLRQQSLANLFRRLIDVERANLGRGRAEAILAARDDFYIGDIGSEIVAFVQSQGGSLSVKDMAEHRVAIEPALHTSYRGVDVYSTGSWSQGPVVPMTLNLLEGYDLAAAGPGSAEFLHRFTESLKLAMADREAFFGDQDHVDVPIAGLLSKAYAEERRSLIGDTAAPALPLPGNPWRHEGREGPVGYVPSIRTGGPGLDTSYVCAMDAEGNAFSATPSDAGVYAPLVPGLGIVVSHRGVQFWNEPGHPQVISPGRRPRITPNPGMLLRDGKALMPFGCPGEDAQCQAMVQVVCAVVDFGMNAQAAIEYPRVVSRSFPSSFHPHGYKPGELHIEDRISQEVRDELAAKGHLVTTLPSFTSATAGVCAIRLLPSGILEGGADPRRESYVVGW